MHAFETPERRPEQEVTITHFRSEDMHVVYLGDLGHALTEDEVAPLRGADIVLIPAGSTPTIAYPDIPPLLDAIGPRLVLPMHYKTPQAQPQHQAPAQVPGSTSQRPGDPTRYQLLRRHAGHAAGITQQPGPRILPVSEGAGVTPVHSIRIRQPIPACQREARLPGETVGREPRRDAFQGRAV